MVKSKTTLIEKSANLIVLQKTCCHLWNLRTAEIAEHTYHHGEPNQVNLTVNLIKELFYLMIAMKVVVLALPTTSLLTMTKYPVSELEL